MSELSDRILTISLVYLGPAAKMFLERQTLAHMDKLKFEDITPSHLPELVKWINISGGLLIGAEKAKEFGEKIRSIS